MKHLQCPRCNKTDKAITIQWEEISWTSKARVLTVVTRGETQDTIVDVCWVRRHRDRLHMSLGGSLPS